MTTNNGTVKKRIRSRERLLGTLLTTASLDVAEVLCELPFDWFFLDLEHSGLTVQDAKSLLQVVAGRKPVLIRVSVLDEGQIKSALDIGAEGIIVPNIKNADEARRAVSFAKYPPLGSRGAGMGRASSFGLSFADYVKRANEETAIVLQIEHKDAVQNLDSILETEEVDALFLGPYDLSGSFGKLGQLDDSSVLDALQTVVSKAEAKGVPLGYFAVTSEGLQNATAKRCSLLAVGSDLLHLHSGAQLALNALRK